MADDSLRELVTVLRNASHETAQEVREIIQRGSLKIKNQMRKDAEGHPHFPKLGPSIRYETEIGNGYVEGVIGPSTGVLAGIAYFGSSRPGGGTVADPRIALDAEAPIVERMIGDAAERAVGR